MLVTSDRPIGHEPSNLRGLQWEHAGFLQLVGNQGAQRLGHVQPTILDDARGPKEQILQINQLGVSPIEILEGRVRALDEVG